MKGKTRQKANGKTDKREKKGKAVEGTFCRSRDLRKRRREPLSWDWVSRARAWNYSTGTRRIAILRGRYIYRKGRRHRHRPPYRMTMTTSRDATTSRLRQTLNPLMTSLGGYHNHPLQTPHSAVSVHSSYPYSAAPAPAQTPIQPYNPQQWVPSPAVGQDRTHQFPQIASVQDAQGKLLFRAPNL